MPIYSSARATNKSILPRKGEPLNVKRRKLTSCLFSGYSEDAQLNEAKDLLAKIHNQKAGPIGARMVERIIPGTGTITIHSYTDIELNNSTETVPIDMVTYQRLESSGEYVRQIQKALLVAVEAIRRRDSAFFNNYEFESIPQGDYDAQGEYIDTLGELPAPSQDTDFYLNEVKDLNGRYDISTEQLVRFVQAYTNNTVDGVVGSDTLSSLDQILKEVRYYNCEDGQIKHDASICEDKATVTIAYKMVNVHVLPDSESETLITLDPSIEYQRRVHVIQDVSNFIAGWLYVQFDRKRADAEGEENPTPASTFGYVRKTSIWPTSMPDSGATLHKIIDGDTVYNIIRDTYYTITTDPDTGVPLDEPQNARGTELRTEATFAGWETARYNQFKFYVNLLLISNNPGRTNYDLNQVIYLVYPGASPLDEDLIDILDDIHPFDNDAAIPNYDYFLEQLRDADGNADWPTWESNDTIRLEASDADTGRYIWIPSPQFANKLYAYINNDQSYMVAEHNVIRNLIIAEWDRGYGIEIQGGIGATFAIPVRGELEGSTYIYRKYTESPNDVVICLRKYGSVQVGLDTGIGGGFYVGSGKRKSSGYGFAARLEATIQAGGRVETFHEYEIPIHDPTTWENAGREDLGVFAIYAALAGIASGALEFAAVLLVKAFSDYNIDPANYLVKSQTRFVGFVLGQAGAIAGFKMGDANDTEYWENNDGSSSHKDPPWHLKKILGLMNAQAGASAGAEFALEHEYTAEYDDLCFDQRSGSRVPTEFSSYVGTNFTLLVEAGANIGPMNLGGFAVSPFMGIKLGIRYKRPDQENPDIPEAVIMIPDVNNLQYSGIPRVEIYAGNGNWDFYENSATEIGVALAEGFTTPDSSAGIIDIMEYIYIKKRFQLISFELAGLKDAFTLQRQMKNFFRKSKYKKFGFGAGAFLDFEGRFSPGDLMDLFETLEDLLITTREEISNNEGIPVEDVNWIMVLIELPYYLSDFLSPSVSELAKKLYSDLLKSFEITNFSFHGELSFGGSIGFRLAAGLKIALDLQAALSITYDQQFIKNNELIIPDDQVALVAELNSYLTDPEMRKALLLFSGDQMNTF